MAEDHDDGSTHPGRTSAVEAAVRDDVPDPQATALRAAEEHTARIANAWDTSQVVHHLGLSVEAVRRSVQNGQLVSFTHAGQLLFPAWQYTGSGVLPAWPKC